MKIDRMSMVRCAEECGELAAILNKAVRFGSDTIDPRDGVATIDKILMEAGDVLCTIKQLGFDPLDLEQAERRKALSIAKHAQFELAI